MTLGALALAGVTCRDRSLTGPGFTAAARVRVAPRVALAARGPALSIGAVRVTLTPLPGTGEPVANRVESFAAGEDELRVELTVQLLEPTQRFVVRVAAADARAPHDTIFRGVDTVTVRVDESATVGTGGEGGGGEAVAVSLVYDGPDKGVVAISVAPGDTMFYTTDSVRMRAVGRGADGAEVAAARFGWSVGDGAAAEVTEDGWLKAKRAFAGVWVYAGTANGATDSVRVSARVPVAALRLTPDTGAALRPVVGSTTQFAVAALDAAGAVLEGRDAPQWSVSNPAKGSVSAAGLFRALDTGTVTLRVAVEGRSAQLELRVQPVPVGRVQIQPLPAPFAFYAGDTVALVAVARDSAGAVLDGRAVAWASRDPNVVTVLADGRAIAMSVGSTWVIATAEGQSDSLRLTVFGAAATRMEVAPDTVTRYLGTAVQYAVRAFDERGHPAAAPAGITWSTASGGAVVSVDGAGRATMAALGTDSVVATAENGMRAAAFVRVRSAITRIDVAPGTTTVHALGARVAYVATAVDTLGAPMAGVAFVWEAANAPVAALDSATAAGAQLVARTNGVAGITASAQGVSGSAALTVQQTPSALAITPRALAIAVGGSVALLAEAMDANGYFVPGVQPLWRSDDASVARVDASSGIVTAVGAGTTRIRATQGALNGEVVVTVATPVIRFALDEVTVGTGAELMIPVTLSAPSDRQVRVEITASTEDVDVSSSLYFAPGQVTQMLQIEGEEPSALGTRTRLIASHDSAVFQPDTLFVTVATAMRVEQANERDFDRDNYDDDTYDLGVGDTIRTRVILQDPAPAGGRAVTFTTSDPGVVRVVPDTVVVPAGHLAANIMIVGVGDGAALVTPVSEGTASVSSSAVVFRRRIELVAQSYGLFRDGALRIGAGMRHQSGMYVRRSVQSDDSLAVSVRHAVPGVVAVPSTVVISRYSDTGIIPVDGLAQGVDTVTVSAPGWGEAKIVVRVMGGTNVRLGRDYYRYDPATARYVYDDSLRTLLTTNAPRPMYVQMFDSLGGTYGTAVPLRFELSSSNPAVATVDSSAVTYGPNDYYKQFRLVPRGTGETWIRVTPPAGSPFRADSVLQRVRGAKLALQGGAGTAVYVGRGQRTLRGSVTLSVPFGLAQATLVRLRVLDPAVARLTDGAGNSEPQATIPTNGYGPLPYIEGLELGTTAIVAEADGYEPDTFTVRVVAPRLDLQTRRQSGSSHDIGDTAYVGDQVCRTYGSYYCSYTPPSVVIALAADSAGQVVSASTALRGRVVSRDTTVLKIWGAAERCLCDSTVRYDARYEYFAEPVGPGRTWLVAELAGGDGWAPDSVQVVVLPRHYRLEADASYFPGDPDDRAGSAMIGATGELQIRLRDRNGSWSNIPDGESLTIRIESSDTTIVKPDSQYLHIPNRNWRDRSFDADFRFLRTGTVRLIVSDSAGRHDRYAPDTTGWVTVGAPKLEFDWGEDVVTLGTRQRFGHFARWNHEICRAGEEPEPLTVYLRTTDASVLYVEDSAGVETDSVVVQPNNECVDFNIVARDRVAMVAVIASTADGREGDTLRVDVGRPRVRLQAPYEMYTTSRPQEVQLYATDQAGDWHRPVEDLTVTLSSSAPGVASFGAPSITIRADAVGHSAYAVTTVAAGDSGVAVLTAAAGGPYADGVDTVRVRRAPLALYTVNDGMQRFTVSRARSLLVDSPAQPSDSVRYAAVDSTRLGVTPAAQLLTQSCPSYWNCAPNYVYRGSVTVVPRRAGGSAVTASAPSHVTGALQLDAERAVIDVSRWTRTPDVFVVPDTVFAPLGGSVPLVFRLYDSTGVQIFAPGEPTALALGGAGDAFEFRDSTGAAIARLPFPRETEARAWMYVKAYGAAAATVGDTAGGAMYRTRQRPVVFAPPTDTSEVTIAHDGSVLTAAMSKSTIRRGGMVRWTNGFTARLRVTVYNPSGNTVFDQYVQPNGQTLFDSYKTLGTYRVRIEGVAGELTFTVAQSTSGSLAARR